MNDVDERRNAMTLRRISFVRASAPNQGQNVDHVIRWEVVPERRNFDLVYAEGFPCSAI